MKNLDTEHIVDPLFKQTTKRFDELSAASLLSANLQANSLLLLQLDSRAVAESSHTDEQIDLGQYPMLQAKLDLPNLPPGIYAYMNLNAKGLSTA